MILMSVHSVTSCLSVAVDSVVKIINKEPQVMTGNTISGAAHAATVPPGGGGGGGGMSPVGTIGGRFVSISEVTDKQ